MPLHSQENILPTAITGHLSENPTRLTNRFLSLIECDNEEVMQENSNKNPTVNSVQRDYMAGEVSKDITKRFLLPEDIVRAHEQGIIHFHDSDYFAQHMHNCCLVNLEDMLQNGTVISETMIDIPKALRPPAILQHRVLRRLQAHSMETKFLAGTPCTFCRCKP